MTDNLLSILGALAAFLMLSAILTLRARRKYAEQWIATVTSINRISDAGSESSEPDSIRLHFKRDDGRSGFVDLDQATYNSRFAGLKPGDRLLKRAGEGLPDRT